MEGKGIHYAAATYDLFSSDEYRLLARLMEPCKSSDPSAAETYNMAMEEYNRVTHYCAGPHSKLECTQWGASGGVSENTGGTPFNNIAHFQNFKAEVEKALSDPNYSADLGPVKSGAPADPAERTCEAGVKDIEKEYKASAANIPRDSVVVQSEAAMWRMAKLMALVEAKCPQSKQYRREVEGLRGMYASTQKTCDALASAPPCKPRLPGKQAVPVPSQAAKPLPPLRDTPAPDCKAQSGANFRHCLQVACEKQKGTLRGKECFTCDYPTGAWTKCPRGSDGVDTAK
jgi:hypothetical protein